MQHSTLAFIGTGNMTRSLIGGLIADGWPADRIWATDPVAEQRDAIARHWPQVHTTGDNGEAARQAEVIVLAVKPSVVREVAEDLSSVLQDHRPLVISIAAGIPVPRLETWLGGGLPIVRAMPNTPALVQSGATGLYAGPGVSEAQRELAETILRAVGLALWIEDEEQMHAVTAVSGSGPAYFFLTIEALEEAAREAGLDSRAARLLAVQTAFGATKLALESDEDAATLRRRVTSKGGTTEQALAELEQGGLRQLMSRAVQAAVRRSRELAQSLGTG